MSEMMHRAELARQALAQQDRTMRSTGTRHRTRHDDPDHQDLFHEITLEFAHGRCAWFALAAAERYDLPLVGLVDGSGKFVHVVCRVGEGFFDAYGIGREEEVLESFTHFMGIRVREPAGLRMFETNARVVRDAFELHGPEHDVEIGSVQQAVERLVRGLGLSLPSPRTGPSAADRQTPRSRAARAAP